MYKKKRVIRKTVSPVTRESSTNSFLLEHDSALPRTNRSTPASRLLIYSTRKKILFLETIIPQKHQQYPSPQKEAVAGRQGGAYESHYAASKFAVMGITQSLAKEVGPKGITVNAFCPGVINTDLWKYLDREMGKLEGLEPTQLIKKVTKLIPLRRVGQPSDVAGLVSFLASKDADYITGQAIFVGGGIIML